ncbi:Bardet-Biedl syndrome 4 protein [Copidosoma floridanum]|uniref:Bardet-Biedl syndrome 4 protein n=1 Tax=Copidosoma floridanum TaxID=29053 RepID=UPI0006C9B998|nr:Bardet-Biedl syndrome 4 protein [Copidosoma floridanum]
MENNNAMGNGRIHQEESGTPSGPRFRRDRSKKNPLEIRPVEKYNWLMYRFYTRLEFDKCNMLIESELKEWGGLTEYPNYLKGWILRREGKIQDSLDSFQKAHWVNPKNVNNAKQIAKSLFLLGDHKKAIDVYLEAEKMCKTPDWEIHHYLGECYTKIKRLEDAKAQLIRSKELTRLRLPYVALAKIYVAEGRINDAIVVYEEAFEAEPENEEIATELGQLYLGLGDTKRALQQFGMALARSPNYSKAILPLAYVVQTNGEYDVAFSKYKIAAATMQESWTVWNNIGMCLFGKQKYISAITCLKRAHYLNPLALPAACNLGIVFLTTGQPASAAIYLCGAVSADPDNAMPYLLLGLALKRLSDLEGAEKALEKAYSLGPQEPHVLVNYAVVLDAQGKPGRALEILHVLNDVTALVEINAQVSKTAKLLADKLKISTDEEQRILADNEV